MTNEKYRKYAKLLQVAGSLTKLFSDNKTPYLYYRLSENIFCKAFGASNVSRSDASVDAILEKTGYGIKTFLNNNGRTMQKIAEFNKENMNFRELAPKELVRKVSELRNERLRVTKEIYGLDEAKYHCIVRSEGLIQVYECNMQPVNISKLKILRSTNNVIQFEDDDEEYSFNLTKSTLFKRFVTKKVLLKIPVKILSEPFPLLVQKFSEIKEVYFEKTIYDKERVYLPLYSPATKTVAKKSGLNQWNASGRVRSPNEVYIPIPSWINEKFPKFFPERNIPFELILPTGKVISAKVCQDNSKALMSNPNSELGDWLLRDVLNMEENELITYAKLLEIGFDSVEIEKLCQNSFKIDFRPIGDYENFLDENST